MTAPLCNCGCGEVVERRSYETDGQWRVRERLGIFRSKCRTNLKPLPAPPNHIASTGRMVGDPTVWNLQRPEGKEQPKEKPVRDAARLAFARSMPCVICGSIDGLHAHHEQEEGHGVMGGKVCDRRSLGLCWRCHKRRHDEGREIYGDMDVEKVIERINAAYDERKTQQNR